MLQNTGYIPLDKAPGLSENWRRCNARKRTWLEFLEAAVCKCVGLRCEAQLRGVEGTDDVTARLVNKMLSSCVAVIHNEIEDTTPRAYSHLIPIYRYPADCLNPECLSRFRGVGPRTEINRSNFLFHFKSLCIE